ncbi:MAG: ABC transporter ATP-binding protein [bacterium]
MTSSDALGSKYTIEIENLSKVYQIFDSNFDRLKEVFNPFGRKYHQEFFALKNISLRISGGRCIGIIGLNGSGKSTLLQCIAGILTPSEGVVKVSGKVSALLELGAGFNPEFTGIENVRFQCAIMGLSQHETEKLLPEIIRFADIGDFVNHPVKTYSSGMYVRLAFSVAINVDPDILIIDEALAVGDIRFQAKCLGKIREFMTNDKTLLFVSHDASAIKSLCNEAYLLDRGQIVGHGDPSHVFNMYNSIIAERDRDGLREQAELAQKAKRSGNQRVKITRLHILNSEDNPTETFVSGETLKIRVELRADEETLGVSVGFLIRDRLGHDIFGTNTDLMGHPIDFKAGNLLRVLDFSVPLNLGENVYTVTVAAHSGNTHLENNYDWINDAGVFKVIQSPARKFAGCASLESTVRVLSP